MTTSKETIYTMSRSEYHAWAIKANRDRHTLPSLDLPIPTDPTKQPVCKSNVSILEQKYIALPSELMFEILNHLLDADEQGSIYNATLVSRHWMNCATPLLFRHPKIQSTYRWATFLLTLMRPNQQYAFGEFVRSINLSSSYEFPGKAKSSRHAQYLDSCLAASRPLTSLVLMYSLNRKCRHYKYESIRWR
jgi:F-box-like